ncbi:CHASE2 domain-containing protein [Microseira wollei]|uniref:Circadian input-output histidine kinase CikA n=1 Tax=Microseira wollei NIES-4236 TaxID=2530354 RepID=A0AAV3XG97_9CYAN|nr:CHASE2 domain-containing protein [Microseira wollei]GET39479.1 two-component hybrid sensor and regulator [Microseira wollei NIES-4236]
MKRLFRQILQRRGIGITVIGVTGAVLALQWSGALQLLEWAILDRWFRLRPLESGEPRVVIVTIDESDISRLGRWPMSDETLAKVLEKVKQQQPRAIGLDLYRNLPVEPGHSELLKIFGSTPNLIGVKKVVGDASGPVVDPPPVLRDRSLVAASDLVVDADGKVRRHLLSLRESRGKTMLTLGTKLALTYLQEENIGLQTNGNTRSLKLGQAKFLPLEKNAGGYVRVDVGGYQILSNFQRLQTGFPKISLTDVLEDRIPANLMRGRIVAIGSTAESLGDRFYTPYTNNIPTAWSGVEIHANLASQIVSAALDGRQLLRGIGEPLEWLWIGFWSSLGGALGWSVRTPRWAIITIPAAIGSLFGSAYLLFLAGWWIVAASPFLALIGAGLASRGYLLWKQLQLSHQELENYAQTLEQKVQQRTQELLEKNIALEKAKQAAEAANRAKSAFLANMSHELRTPLNAILGFSQLLSRELELQPQYREQIGIINRSGNHLLNLINDILEISKIEAGKAAVNLSQVDLYNLLQTWQEMFQLRATSKGLQLICDLASDLPRYVETDEGKLSQILINLLGNAVKFTEKGSVTLRAKIGKGKENHNSQLPIPFRFTNSQLFFEVEDTGPGIAPKEIEKLFATFVQTEAGVKSQQGTGLGLAISYQLAQLMGGEMTVKSTVGQGSIFQLVLPVSIREFAEQADPIDALKVIGLAPNQPKYRILVVEDVAENRLFLVQLLSLVGFEVRAAENGQVAIVMWESWHPDLILMDMRMPVMDGYEATRQIKATAAGQKTEIVALTASVFDNKPAILAAGCNDCVQKPFRESELFAKIAEHLGVQYVYSQNPLSPKLARSEENGNKSAGIVEQTARENLAASLSAMPTQWKTELYDAALLLNEEGCMELLDQIAKDYPDLYEMIKNLLINFRFDLVMNLIKPDENGE